MLLSSEADTRIHGVGKRRFTVAHLEKDVQVLTITMALLTLCFACSQL